MTRDSITSEIKGGHFSTLTAIVKRFSFEIARLTSSVFYYFFLPFSICVIFLMNIEFCTLSLHFFALYNNKTIFAINRICTLN